LKVSLKWLKDYVDLSGIAADDIVEKLTTTGLEVDDVIDYSKLFENYVVGHVVEKVKHPNADKLSLCRVDNGEQVLDVVCGAPNVDSDQKVVLAKSGAVLPDTDFTIKKVKIRGQESNGMICSEKELGLGDDHTGIMVLDNKLKPGQPVSEALGLDDVIIDIDITPNRADAFCHIGVARDLAAAFNRKLVYPKIKLNRIEEDINDYAKVVIKNKVDCPRYAALVVVDVEIAESPDWLKSRLISIGLRPINNVVDVTNFVNHEFGQPLHAFDLDRLAESKIVVKSAGDSIKFTTLDSKERTMQPTDLMICDGEKPVAVAGVMGGENSEVTESTRNILIESAYFRPGAVRKTSKKLGLSTDSSIRFERGVNPENCVNAAKRAAQLIAELGNGKILSGEIDAYPKVIERQQIKLRFDRVNRLLGVKIKPAQIIKIFKKLEFDIAKELKNSLTVSIPLFRPDIGREVDLIEEVARIYGYDNIPGIERISVDLEKKIDESEFRNKITDILQALGLNEIYTNSLLNKETAAKFGNPINVLNPQSVEMANLRPSLLPGTLSSISKNIKVRESNLRFFEIGNIFENKTEGEIESFDDFEESEHLMISLTGNAVDQSWYEEGRSVDIYDLKGIIEELLDKLNLSADIKILEKHSNKKFDLHFESRIDGQILLNGGKIDADTLKTYDIEQEVFICDIDLSVLKTIKQKPLKFSHLLKYPKVHKDFAVILDKNIGAGEVEKTILKNCSKLLKNVKLFDIFEAGSLGTGKKSLAFQLEFYDKERTLTEKEVESEFWKAIESVKRDFNAELRG
jgi:phenylalanyl-tRNA synthetase beta chain